MFINILNYFEETLLKRDKNRIMVVDHKNSYTFEEIELYSKNLAWSIVERINTYNTPVVVLLPRSAETIVANLGILYSGNFFTNLDIKNPVKRLMNIINHINPSIIVSDIKNSSILYDNGINKEKILLIENAWSKTKNDCHNKIVKRKKKLIDTDPLCIVNTSGSTGIPKSVILSHRGIIDFAEWAFELFSFNEDEKIGNLSPLYFDLYLFELCLCLAKGCTLIIIPEDLKIFPINLIKYIKEMNITFILWVPTIMVNIANLKILENLNIENLKKIWFAGEVMPVKHINYWRKHMPDSLFVNLYGPIEISVDCTYYIVAREFNNEETLPIGFPCRNSDVFILNENNKLTDMGEIGEICVRGNSLALGYWNDLEKTKSVFVQNPIQGSYPEVIYRTGDLGYKNERNEFIFVGRKDYMIKHSGYRIELQEIEHAVVSLNIVDNACVLYNSKRKQITLFYQAKQEIEVAIIVRELKALLPKYMLPSKFHYLPELPINKNGKIDRYKLQSKIEL